MSEILGPKFWDKLSQISTSVGMNPEDLLAVMYYESGLNPAAHNKNGNASGLIQFMPDTLHGLGFKGSHEDFRKIDAVKQLDYVSQYVNSKAKFNGSGFKSAAQYYVANLWPVALKLPEVQAEDPRAVIIDSNPTRARFPGVSIKQERQAYEANTGLDVDKDGKITYRDLQSVMNGVKKSSGYRQAVASLSSGQEFAVGDKNKSKPSTLEIDPSNVSFLTNLNGMLDKFLSAIATSKKEIYKQLPKNNIIIKIESGNLIDSLEFSRVLTIALDEELQAEATTFTDKNNVEVLCSIHGPSKICVKAVSQFCNVLAKEFKMSTKKIGGISIDTFISTNENPSYQELDIKLALSAYRQFHLKFIK